MIVDALRHYTVLNPEEWTDRVDVIGCGAIGSHIATQVLKLGIGGKVHLWDDDVVGSHNIANQQFHPRDIGKNKAKMIRKNWGGKVHEERFVGHKPLSRILLVAADSMAARKDIVENNALSPYTKLIVETRMGLWGGRVYVIDPRVPENYQRWMDGWYPDEETVEVQENTGSACQVSQTLGASASIIANVAVIQMLRWWRSVNGDSDRPEFETILCFKPLDLWLTP